MKEYLKLLLVPLGLLVIYLTMAFLWKVFGLPSDDQMIPLVKEYFNQYGILIVFLGALIEGFFIVGQYFPGGFIIFLGVISSVGDIPRAIAVVSVTSLAFFIAYTLNYFVGKYGWYKVLLKFGFGHSLEMAKGKLEKQGMNAIVFSYWEPNLASIIATAAGTLSISLRKFSIYSLFGIVIWNIFWGVLVYTLGDNALKIIGVKYVLVIFGIWILILILKKFISGRFTSRKI
ncbi:MAG: DedA family protein [Candidatus Taylorbacteria bacterium]|nr:DedA family protein [Candidatus Taylorbacteria bacterium]